MLSAFLEDEWIHNQKLFDGLSFLEGAKSGRLKQWLKSNPWIISLNSMYCLIQPFWDVYTHGCSCAESEQVICVGQTWVEIPIMSNKPKKQVLPTCPPPKKYQGHPELQGCHLLLVGKKYRESRHGCLLSLPKDPEEQRSLLAGWGMCLASEQNASCHKCNRLTVTNRKKCGRHGQALQNI